MPPKTLRFRARGTALCMDIDALYAGTKRFVGRKADLTSGPVYDEFIDGRLQPVRAIVWAPTGEAQDVAYRAEYVRECAGGALWPDNAETADACGVPFDPNFGEGPKSPVRAASSDAKSKE